MIANNATRAYRATPKGKLAWERTQKKYKSSEKGKKTWIKNYRIRTYGITPEILQEMFEQQESKCAICRAKTNLCIDHIHTSGKVRGLLCGKCNRGLGSFNDDPLLLSTAISYLKGK